MKSKQKIMMCCLMIIPAIGLVSYSAKAANSKPPEPTVEDCVEKFDKTEDECEEMIENMKNRKPGEKGMKQGGPGGLSENGENRPSIDKDKENNSNIVDSELVRMEKMKTEEEKRFSKTETRIEKIIEFLNSKDVDGIDTGKIEADLETFESKTDAILSAYDTYVGILNDLQDNDATELSDEAKESKENIKNLMNDLRDFFKNTLRTDIKEQLDMLEDEND
jgi:hypothetical protein